PGGVLGGHGERHRLGVGAGEEQGQQVLVPGEPQHDEEGGDQAGHRQRQGDGAEHPERRRPVDHRRLLQLPGELGEVVAHQPDDDGQVGGGVGDDQGGAGVQQPQGGGGGG